MPNVRERILSGQKSCPKCGKTMAYRDRLLYVSHNRGRSSRYGWVEAIAGYYECPCGNFYYTTTLKKFDPKKNIVIPREGEDAKF